jgi:hypothetical protein
VVAAGAPTAEQQLGQEWRRIDRDRADAQVLRRAAAWLREGSGRAGHAGLQYDKDAHALAVLLDVADGIADLDSGVRWQAVESCRVLLGESMASPGIWRTRRR